MGVALYVALERDINGLDHFMSGKALAWASLGEEDKGGLEEIAQTLGIKPLHEFCSADPGDIIAMFGGDPEDAAEEFEGGVPATEWFPANEGAATARALREHLLSHPNLLTPPKDLTWNFQEAVEEDLKDIERILTRADAEGVRWYLAVDC